MDNLTTDVVNSWSYQNRRTTFTATIVISFLLVQITFTGFRPSSESEVALDDVNVSPSPNTPADHCDTSPPEATVTPFSVTTERSASTSAAITDATATVVTGETHHATSETSRPSPTSSASAGTKHSSLVIYRSDFDYQCCCHSFRITQHL